MPGQKFGLVIHGGAGEILREEMPTELEERFRTTLGHVLAAGYAVLDDGGTSLDAVAAAVVLLEDSPLFNAGHGAVINSDGECEHDAAIMSGEAMRAGAVAGVRRIRNPILLAREVMLRSRHVLLAGTGAEEFAEEIGSEFVPNEYFRTPFRVAQREAVRRLAQKFESGTGEHSATSFTADDNYLMRELKYGTVGCVALDRQGGLAAGTSTGGMLNKRFGRVGDAPIVGAGTYANDVTCAVSATGQGEYFMRACAAHEVSARMEHARESLFDAATRTLRKVGALGGSGGLIAIDRAGNVALPFNSSGMYRAFRVFGQAPRVALFGDE